MTLHIISSEMLLYATEHLVEAPVYNRAGWLEDWQIKGLRKWNAAGHHMNGEGADEAKRLGMSSNSFDIYQWKIRSGNTPSYWAIVS